MRYFFFTLLILINLISLTGCVAAATTAAGVGGSAAITHTINGITYRTFTSPPAKVRTATIRALARMQIQLVSDGLENKTNIRLVKAKTAGRKIEIQLEPISPNTTRMRVIAKKGSSIFYDASTAEEIIQQTKLSLG